MTIIIYLAALAVLLLLLYLFQRRIIEIFSLVSLLVFGTNKIGIYLYFCFFLPGVILHELAHLFTALVLGVPTGQITIFPCKKETDNDQSQDWTLGQVESAETDPIRSSLIGLAPMIVGVLSLVVISNLIFGNRFGLEMLNQVQHDIQHDGLWIMIVGLYFILVFANTMFLSKTDRSSIWALPITAMIIFLPAKAVGLIGFLNEKGIFSGLEKGFSEALLSLILVFSLTVLIDFIFILPLIFLTKILWSRKLLPS